MNSPLSPLEREALDRQERINAFWHRFAPLTPHLMGEGVTELTVNRLGEIDVTKNGRWITIKCDEVTTDFLSNIGKRISTFAKKPFDEMNTSLSADLPSGERVEMTHPPTCEKELRYLNIRRHVAEAFPHSHLVSSGYYERTKHDYSRRLSAAERDELAEFLSDDEKELWRLAKRGDFAAFMEKAVLVYQNILISGATGGGKTTYMRALIELIPTTERIITIEDTREMPLANHPHSQALFYKKTVDGPGAFPKQVLESVMRKTPDRVLLAELRGDEALYYLTGVLSSGHPGGITTTHGNSPKEAFSRIGYLIAGSAAGSNLGLETTLRMLHTTLNVVLQLVQDKDTGERRVTAIYYDPMYRLSLLG